MDSDKMVSEKYNVQTAQDLIDYITNTFDDPSVVYVYCKGSNPLHLVHQLIDMQDGSFTHDLIIN